MKFTSLFIALLFSLSIVSCSKILFSRAPEHRLIKNFSRKVELKTGCQLRSYGFNLFINKEYNENSKIGDFDMSYGWLGNPSNDSKSVKKARCLIVSITNSFLKELNNNKEITEELEVHPFTADQISIGVRFLDNKEIEFGTGISLVRVIRGKVKYECYDIEEYTGDYRSTYGKHRLVHEETYDEALKIVKEQGCLEEL